MRIAKKIQYVDAFEYGSGDFPIWFNVLVGSRITLFGDYIFTPKDKNIKYAGRIEDRHKLFKFGDIIVRDEKGNIKAYNKFDFIKHFDILES